MMRCPSILLLSTTLALGLAVPAAARDVVIPSPRVVIYPGDVVRNDMLTDMMASSVRVPLDSVAQTERSVVGKMARRTLLPNQPIPLQALGNARLVRNGSEVTLFYSEGGLRVTTVGAALQDGSEGDMIKVRNSESGIVVSGFVQPDGSVRVEGG